MMSSFRSVSLIRPLNRRDHTCMTKPGGRPTLQPTSRFKVSAPRSCSRFSRSSCAASALHPNTVQICMRSHFCNATNFLEYFRSLSPCWFKLDENTQSSFMMMFSEQIQWILDDLSSWSQSSWGRSSWGRSSWSLAFWGLLESPGASWDLLSPSSSLYSSG